jgi:hypothetical protein
MRTRATAIAFSHLTFAFSANAFAQAKKPNIIATNPPGPSTTSAAAR